MTDVETHPTFNTDGSWTHEEALQSTKDGVLAISSLVNLVDAPPIIIVQALAGVAACYVKHMVSCGVITQDEADALVEEVASSAEARYEDDNPLAAFGL